MTVGKIGFARRGHANYSYCYLIELALASTLRVPHIRRSHRSMAKNRGGKSMSNDKTFSGSILRVFEARAKQGCADALSKKFATISIDVVRNKSGNQGYFFGNSILDESDFVFVSVWKDLASIRKLFGEEWQSSFLPPGYSELIEECSIKHIALGTDWHSHE
jgi:quinol monooxygenase YgiN